MLQEQSRENHGKTSTKLFLTREEGRKPPLVLNLASILFGLNGRVEQFVCARSFVAKKTLATNATVRHPTWHVMLRSGCNQGQGTQGMSVELVRLPKDTGQVSTRVLQGSAKTVRFYQGLRHAHDFHQVTLLLSAPRSLSWSVNDAARSAKSLSKGELVICPANVPTSVTAADPSST